VTPRLFPTGKNNFIHLNFGPALVSAAFIACAIISPALAVQSNPQVSESVPCGVLRSYEGEVQLLDSTRSQLLPTHLNSGIACGGWISVDSGWVEIRDKAGHTIRLGSQSFAQLPMGEMTLYKGTAYLEAEQGSPELGVITANGRARIKQGSALLIFNPDTEETQLVALENQATLENRFESTGNILLHAGEATTLNFKLLRTVPTVAQVASLSSLKPKFTELHLAFPLCEKFMRLAQKRGERRFAAQFPAPNDSTEAHSENNRSPASVQLAVKKNSRKRGELGSQFDAKISEKLTGSPEGNEQILHPDGFYGRPRKVSVTVEDPASGLNRKRLTREDAEKRKLIEELSKIRD